MSNINDLYYNKFLKFVVSTYESVIKQAKPGSRMKITGLSLDKLQKIIFSLKSINKSVKVFILSDSVTGEDYIHATKLIELRNECPDALLALIPSNSSTSAEDSYGDAAFQNLSVSDLQSEFLVNLIQSIPSEREHLWRLFLDLFVEFKIVKTGFLTNLVNYLLFVDSQSFTLDAWGNGLQYVGMIPDQKLAFDEPNLKRYFKLNYEMCSSLLFDFSLTELDRVNKLPLKVDSIQKEIIAFLTTEKENDRISLCQRIYEQYPNLNFDCWKQNLTINIDKANVSIMADLLPGTEDGKELIKDESGNLVLNIVDGNKKGKVSFSIIVDPAPVENPDIYAFEISLIRREDFVVVDTLKKAKVGNNRKNKKRKLSVNIANETYESGDYMLRVNAIDENGVTLNVDNDFKDNDKQNKWEIEVSADPNKSKEQFRQENQAAYCNETVVFTINNSISNDDVDDSNSTAEKRAKVDTYLQADFKYRISHLINGQECDEDEVDSPRSAWQTGSLNDIFQFDFTSKFAYQIQIPKKLKALEKALLDNKNQLGGLNAIIGANLTDVSLKSIRFNPCEVPDIPEELKRLRVQLFDAIQNSISDGSGLVETFNIRDNMNLIMEYLTTYDSWLSDLQELNLSESGAAAIQFIDIVKLDVELPNGSYTSVCLISPLHPLRLGWLVNLVDLYQDWEEKTEQNKDYRKAWNKKLDQLFYGKLTMDIAPLILADEVLQDPYQYIGELTFGWGIYSRPELNSDRSFSSDARQIKAYVSSLLNISHEKSVDSDVSSDLVARYIKRYTSSHPYVKKIVLNLFNAGDAISFVNALKQIEISVDSSLSYEIRMFTDSNLIKSGSALRELINPESTVAEGAESFAQASGNRLFPKLRFSLNNIKDFVDNHDKYQAHLSFLVNPFQIQSTLVRPTDPDRSFYLNALVCRSVLSSEESGSNYVWNRFISESSLPNPVSEFANTEISLLASLQRMAGHIMSNTIDRSVPATTLMLKESDRVLINFVHDVSDWVVTFDKNMGPEIFDLPASEESGRKIPYLLDYVPGQETTGLSAFLTSRPTSEIEGLMMPVFKNFGIDISGRSQFLELLEDVRAVSSSLIMQAGTTQNKAFEVLGTTLTKRFLKKKGLLEEAFIIPIDLHKELFVDLTTDDRERADSLLVNIDLENREIIFTIVEIKCRKSLTSTEELDLKQKIQSQLLNTVSALQQHFDVVEGNLERLDRELQIIELVDLLSFYIKRSLRYNQLDSIVAEEYIRFLSELEKFGFTLKYKQIGVIYNFDQNERQKKDFVGESCIFSMGSSVISEILDDNGTLNTERLNQMDKDAEFVSAFEPNRKETILRNISIREGRSVQVNDDNINKDSIAPFENESVSPLIGDSVVVQDIPEDNKPENVEKAPTTISEETIAEIETEIVESSSAENHFNQKPVESEIFVETSVESKKNHIDDNYESPICDVIIGKNDMSSPQYGILGKTLDNKRFIGIDLNECNTISLFGVQGAGKSYTIGTITEMTLKQFSKVNKLPAPLSSVIFHYSESMDYAPEFTSMVYPNDEAKQLARLKNEYGAEPNSVSDVLLLTPTSQLETRQNEYPDIQIAPIGFAASELNVADWMFLLGAMGNDSAYIKELKQIMKSCRTDMTLSNLRKGVDSSEYLSTAQKKLANQKLDFASEYINNKYSLKQFMKPGRLIIVDLRDEFIEKDEALGLFVVMLNIFASVKAVAGKTFNKFIVFDEAHKYMNNPNLVTSITTAIREMRHKGVSIMIASQDPMSLPNEIIELSSIVALHKFSSPAWVKHVQKSITPLQILTASAMSALGAGEAYVWATKATDKLLTQKPVKISIRPRVTKHGGDTINAVK